MFDRSTTGGTEPQRLQACFDVLRSIDTGSCDAETVSTHLGDLGRLRALIDSVEAGLTRRADELHRAGKSPDGHDTLQQTQRTANTTTTKRARRAKVLDEVPELDDALNDGTINAEHADAFAGVLENTTPQTRAGLRAAAPELVTAATTMQPDTFRRHAQRKADQLTRDQGLDRFKHQQTSAKARKWINHTTGMYHLTAELDPELGAKLFNALETEIESRWHTTKDLPLHQRPTNDRIAAQSLVDLTTSGGSHRHPNLASITVLVDYKTLLNGLHEHSKRETSQGVDLTPDTIRRLACDANILPTVMSGPSMPLDVGRKQRTATTAQRTALRAIHDTCAITNCDTRYDHCQIHHITHWSNGGTSNLDNLIPLCNKHHHQTHEDNHTLHIDTDRTATLTPPPAPEPTDISTRTPKTNPVPPSRHHNHRDIDTPPPHPPPARQPARTGAP